MEPISPYIDNYLALANKGCSLCSQPFSAADFGVNAERKVHKTACEHFFHTDCLKGLMRFQEDGRDIVCPSPLCTRTISFEKESQEWADELCAQQLQDTVSREDNIVDVAQRSAQKRKRDASELGDEEIARMLQKKFDDEAAQVEIEKPAPVVEQKITASDVAPSAEEKEYQTLKAVVIKILDENQHFYAGGWDQSFVEANALCRGAKDALTANASVSASAVLLDKALKACVDSEHLLMRQIEQMNAFVALVKKRSHL